MVTTLSSICCDAKAVGGLVEQDEGDWGVCAQCNDWAMFEEDSFNAADTDRYPMYTAPERQNTFTGANQALKNATDAQRLRDIGPKCNLPNTVVANFQPKIISWVTPRIGITSRDGVDQALEDGHFVINTAAEIYNKAQVKIAVDAGSGQVLRQLNQIKDIMTNVLATTDQKVVVHCAMGMERSVLSVVWFMANTWGMELKTALTKIQEKRPIALDRLSWIAQ